MKRVTLNLPDDADQAARTVAAAKGVSLSDAVAELARRGLDAGARIDESKPFPCFVLKGDVPPITLDQTLSAEQEL